MSHLKYDPEYPNFAFPPDSRKTILAKCTIVHKEIASVSYLPALINKKSQPEMLPHADKRSEDVVGYMDWCCKTEHMDTRFSWAGEEVLIET
jgi:hypothetical protein